MPSSSHRAVPLIYHEKEMSVFLVDKWSHVSGVERARFWRLYLSSDKEYASPPRNLYSVPVCINMWLRRLSSRLSGSQISYLYMEDCNSILVCLGKSTLWDWNQVICLQMMANVQSAVQVFYSRMEYELREYGKRAQVLRRASLYIYHCIAWLNKGKLPKLSNLSYANLIALQFPHL